MICDKVRGIWARHGREGIAIGTGTGLAVTIETVADWARELERRGFVLVPASAAFQGFMG